MLPRPTWKGYISFGLVTIPVSLYPAEKANELQFNMLDKSNKAKVKYVRVNESTGKEVPWENIVKGYKLENGEYVILNDEDFKKAAVEATQTVEIEGFTDKKAIDYIYLDKPYYLLPDKKGAKGYILLKNALEDMDMVAIAKVVISTRQHLAIVMPEDDGLMLNLLRFQSELRPQSDYEFPKGSLAEHNVSKKEIDMAKQLVNSMKVEWKPEQYHDEYRDALMKWIGKKAKLGDTAQPEEPTLVKKEPKIIDMMEMLRKSIANAKQPSKSQEPKQSNAKESTPAQNNRSRRKVA